MLPRQAITRKPGARATSGASTSRSLISVAKDQAHHPGPRNSETRVIGPRGKTAVPAEPVQFPGDREQRVVCRLMGQVIPLAPLDAGGTAAPPQLGSGSSQQQFVQAGEGLFPLRGAAGVATGSGQAPEPLTRLLVQRTTTAHPPGGRAPSQQHAQSLRDLPKHCRQRGKTTPVPDAKTVWPVRRAPDGLSRKEPETV